jgi:hypothetical protein
VDTDLAGAFSLDGGGAEGNQSSAQAIGSLNADPMLIVHFSQSSDDCERGFRDGFR